MGNGLSFHIFLRRKKKGINLSSPQNFSTYKSMNSYMLPQNRQENVDFHAIYATVFVQPRDHNNDKHVLESSTANVTSKAY